MRNLPILIATFPMSPSVNEMYMTVNGRRVLTEVARRYKNEIKTALFQGTIDEPYKIHYIDALGARAIREACDTAKLKRRQPPAYRFKIQYDFIYTNERRDIDNGIKPLQDSIMDWVGANDRCVNSMPVERFIDHEGVARVDVVVWEYIQQKRPGELIALALQEFTDVFSFIQPTEEQFL